MEQLVHIVHKWVDYTVIFKNFQTKKILNLKVRPILSLDNVEKGLEKSLPERYHKLFPLNLEAIQKGQELVEDVQLV